MINTFKHNSADEFKSNRLLALPSVLCGLYLFICLFSASCVNTKKIPYFSDIPDTVTNLSLRLPEYNNPLVKKDDLIFISIQTIDPEVTRLLNQGNYIVDQNGEVELPIINKIKISDLTIEQARDLIKQKALMQFNAATVDVRFANFKITILGEVNKPSTYILPNNRTTILEAIALAGDLTIFGKRENVLLIRQPDSSESSQIAVRLNLNSKSLISSPYYYVKPRDFIYVEPNRSKILNTDFLQAKYLTIATSFLSLLIIIFTRIK